MMRDAYPETWIDEMCGCFSPAQASFVRKTLEEENEICDVFVLCKVLRSFMRRVLEPRLKVNKINLGPMEKERFLFQLQDVESSRHMAFHGEGVSVEEASLSLMSMKEFFSTLSGYQPTEPDQGLVQTCFSTHQKQLQVMIGILDYIIDESCQCSVWLPLQTIYGVLVYRCLSTLESVMRTILQDVNMSAFSACADKCPGGTVQLSELIRLMKKEASRPTQENKLKDYITVKGHFNAHLIKLSKLFAGGASLRNRLAHGAHLAKDDVHTVNNCTLNFLQSIDHKPLQVNLSDFDFDLDRFICKKEPAEHLCSSTEDRKLGIIIRVGPNTRNAQLHFRSQCLVRDEDCIGREQELAVCLKAIRDSCTLYQNSDSLSKGEANERKSRFVLGTRCVVITGPAGVGKSTLARKVVGGLKGDFKRQSWVCANTMDHLKSVLSSKLFSKRPKTKECQGSETGRHIQALQQGELIVLDNFRQGAVPFVSEVLAYSPHVLIITAYTARALLPAGNGFRCLVRVSLSPFKTENSLELVKKELKLKTECLSKKCMRSFCQKLARIVEEDLDNLPLAISLFAVLLRRSCKENAENIGDSKGAGVECLMKVRPEMMRTWENAERASENSFHVRGLTGTVTMALEEIKDNPQALMMVLVGSLLPKVPFPWGKLGAFTVSALYNCHGISSTDAHLAFSVLGSTLDSLLGKNNKQRRDLAERLEDMGLVMCEEEGEVISMHQLIKMCIRQSLNDSSSFFQHLTLNTPWRITVEWTILLLLGSITSSILESFSTIGPHFLQLEFDAFLSLTSHNLTGTDFAVDVNGWKTSFLLAYLAEDPKEAMLRWDKAGVEFMEACILEEIFTSKSCYPDHIKVFFWCGVDILVCGGEVRDLERLHALEKQWQVFSPSQRQAFENKICRALLGVYGWQACRKFIKDHFIKFDLNRQDMDCFSSAPQADSILSKIQSCVETSSWEELAGRYRKEVLSNLRGLADFFISQGLTPLTAELIRRLVEISEEFRHRLGQDKERLFNQHPYLVLSLIAQFQCDLFLLNKVMDCTTAVHLIDKKSAYLFQQSSLMKLRISEGARQDLHRCQIRVLQSIANGAIHVGWSKHALALLNVAIQSHFSDQNMENVSYHFVLGYTNSRPVSVIGSVDASLSIMLLQLSVELGNIWMVGSCSAMAIKLAVHEILHFPRDVAAEGKVFAQALLTEACHLLALVCVLTNSAQSTLLILHSILQPSSSSSDVQLKGRVARELARLVRTFSSSKALIHFSSTLTTGREFIEKENFQQALFTYENFLCILSGPVGRELLEFSSSSQRLVTRLLQVLQLNLYTFTAELHMLENEWDDAKHLLQITLSDMERFLGHGHLHIKTSQTHLALSKVFHHEGKVLEALQHAKMAVDMQRAVFGSMETDEITNALEQYQRLIESKESESCNAMQD